MSWEIQEKRTEHGSLLEMTLSEGRESPSRMGPVEQVRQVRVGRRPNGDWYFRLSGPRGGVQPDGMFSQAALRSFLTRLRVEIE